MLEKMFDRSKVVEKALDGSWLRNEAISQNIANVDTPNYKRKTVSFESALSSAMDSSAFKGKKSLPKHLDIGAGDVDSVQPTIAEDNTSTSYRLDGNNVDIENEMAQMAKNTIQYNTLIQRLNSQFRTLKSVISEGRK